MQAKRCKLAARIWKTDSALRYPQVVPRPSTTRAVKRPSVLLRYGRQRGLYVRMDMLGNRSNREACKRKAGLRGTAWEKFKVLSALWVRDANLNLVACIL